ncbi:hypothetical protein WDZ17_00270 [Pseudokineococcus basanitobsidens]|uniref:Uncharacterized protein n=1 Tax=Pseudokineococcus basanitobsidens TaxID=1926649 RepID=A0ABU8RFD4_9ACTN
MDPAATRRRTRSAGATASLLPRPGRRPVPRRGAEHPCRAAGDERAAHGWYAAVEAADLGVLRELGAFLLDDRR